MEKQSDNLESQVETNHERMTKIKQEQLNEFQETQTIEKQQREMTTMREHLKNLLGQLTTIEDQNEQQGKEKQQRISKLQSQEQEMKTMKEHLRNLHDQLTTKNKLLREEQQRVTELQRQLVAKDAELQSQFETNEQGTTTVREQLEGRLRGEQQQVTELQSQLETNQQEMATMREQLERRLQEGQQQVTELQSQLERNQQEMTAIREQLEERLPEEQQQVTELQSHLETTEQELTATREQLTETQQRESEPNRILAACQRNNPPDPPDWVISRNDIQITGQELGRGAWGTVFRGKFHGCVVAIKEIHENIMSDNNRRLFEREVDIASKCRHPCLLQFIGATINEERPLLVTEIMDSSLKVRLQNEPLLSVTEVCVISLDVARALNYLHQKRPVPIIHHDISSANVLLWLHDAKWRAKVADYGTANFVRQSNINYAGAIIYCAPESQNEDPDQAISCKVDVYSFGVLLCEICIREQPDPQRRYWQIAEMGKGKFQNLVRHCIRRHPGGRPNMESVIEELERPEIEETGAA